MFITMYIVMNNIMYIKCTVKCSPQCSTTSNVHCACTTNHVQWHLHPMYITCSKNVGFVLQIWFHWLDNAFGILAGRLPISVVDVDKIGKSPTLPMILRDPDHFLPLPTIVRDRHQVEFKRRFGLSGDASGFDVDCDWKPTMTPAYGLPILLDPRLNNVTTKFGLKPSKKDEYEILIHNLHYEWYTRTRLVKIN